MFCSIIVPTYNTDPSRLEALVASVDAQTLDNADFELIFVDDGSTTDVVSRLKDIAASRPNVRILELENSGWACRPRNQGTLIARGEWVLYMDHDDVIFPEALARLKAFTSGLDADVVNPREVRTKKWSWGWDNFVADRPTTDNGPLAFLPMTPHKLYRRAFLQQHDIAFIEDRRVLWEDVYFNMLAYSKGARVAIFSSYPIYHWVTTGENTSSGFGSDRAEMWASLRTLLNYFSEVLTDQQDIDRLLLHWYKSRVLKFVGNDDEREPDLDTDYDYARAVALDLIPERLDAQLGPVHALIARLLRANDKAGIRALTESVSHYVTHSTARSFAWEGDTVTFDVSTNFLQNDEPLALLVEGDRVLWAVPPGITQGDVLDITDGLAESSIHLSVRGVTSRESTRIGSPAPVLVDPSESPVHPAVAMKARISVPELIANRSLVRQRFDIAARVVLPGHTTHRAVRVPADDFEPLRAIVDNHHVSAVRGKELQLTMAVDTEGASVMHLLEKDAAPTIAMTTGAKTVFSVAFPGLHVFGRHDIDCEIAATPVGADGTTQVGPRLVLHAHIEKVGAEVFVRSEPSLVPAGRFRITVGVGTVKKQRIGLTTVEKSPLQRIAGFAAARVSR